MFRPRWEDIKLRGYIQCSCGVVLQTQEAVREHWQRGHFDTPLYEDICQKKSPKLKKQK